MKTKKITLHVLFDTSVIYNSSPSELFRKEITDFIFEHSKPSVDIEISWNIPEMVLEERKYQMLKKGNELLPNIRKLEKLLGHNLNITEQIVRSRIEENVKIQLENNKVSILKPDTSKINWEEIILNSVYRNPPFEDNEKEKGFRDSIILESFKQLVNEKPNNRNAHRIIFISNDKKLKESSEPLKNLSSNIHLLNSLEEFSSLINILSSTITEELILKISEEANRIFFEEKNDKSLFYSEKIKDSILEEFSRDLELKHEKSDSRDNKTWWINKPGFERKVGQKIYWKTIIEIDFESSKNIYEEPQKPSLFNSFRTETNYTPKLFNYLEFQKKEKVAEGKSRIEVLWSVSLTTTSKLRNPKIENIEFLETIFD